MQTKFKRHQEVILKAKPNAEYIEYHEGFDDTEIKGGMKGRINIILPNGQYHVEIFNEKGNLIAYAPMQEEDLDSV